MAPSQPARAGLKRLLHGGLAVGLLALVAAPLVAVPRGGADGAEFRRANRISSPKLDKLNAIPGVPRLSSAEAGRLFPGIEMRPVPRAVAEPIIRDIVSKWNTADFASTLSPAFNQAQSLEETIQDRFSRQSRLEVIAVQGIQTLTQRIEAAANDGTDREATLVSDVLARVRTRLTSREGGQASTFDSDLEVVVEIRQEFRR
ncbi:MAG: hypothetical protein KDE22_11705 [Rhodobacterales bacterium]|nr:hypothetical protein [Rhodobacterales bacterium]